ncbi:hypothetical protein PhCBS80983_g02022 [Powellomyces hirtus]|uniref:Molybdopterin synthase sulfur carrier subunit n=1 Tax=Powellomyces hirtus TaxID=109895 RepID=A0A507E8J0_9FUNG|nr:hypothetical protein PhCBS80983_g02022 [Powellomyces hirtus]
MSSNTIQVLYFAGARDATGIPSETLSIPSGSSEIAVPAFIQTLITQHPKLSKVFSTAILAINNQYVDHEGRLLEGGESVTVKVGDEVAVIPPVSGG